MNPAHAVRGPKYSQKKGKTPVLARDEAPRSAAVDVLAEVGRPEMADALRDVATRFPDQPFLAFAVRTALKRIG